MRLIGRLVAVRRGRHLVRPVLAITILAGSVSAAAKTVTVNAVGSPAPLFVPQIQARVPHDVTAFTEGLVLINGHLYESSGLNGQSSLRENDVQSGQVQQRVNLPAKYFGEGIAVHGQQIVQLTWQNHLAFIYDLNSFKQIGTFSYDGEGWGLCFDGQQYYMSNGSSRLVARDPTTFAMTREIDVVLDGQPVVQLNELECVGDSIYANVWLTNRIVRIDKATGKVTARIEVPTNILTVAERIPLGVDGVLNGIAYDPNRSLFLITGKLWPWLFWVTFTPASYSYF